MTDRILQLEIKAQDGHLFKKEWNIIESLDHENLLTYEGPKQLPEPVNGVHRVELKSDAQHGTLDELLQGKLSDVPKFEILEILWQLISGLEHLHLHDIVHGHLTLDNVLVSKEDKSLLLLTHYGFGQWRSPHQVDKVQDMRAVKQLSIYILTEGKCNDEPVTAADLTAVQDKVKPWVLNFIQDLDRVATWTQPSSAILYHPLFMMHTDCGRRRFREVSTYEEMFEPFTVERVQKFQAEMDPNVRQAAASEDISKLEKIASDFFSKDFSRIYDFLDRGLKECPVYFSHFIWRSVPLILSKPKIVLDRPASLSFSSIIKGTWYLGTDVKRIALKKGKWGTDSEPTDLKNQRFIKEMEELRKVDYFFIIKFLGYVTRQSFKHVVTDLCEGNLRMYSHKLIDNMNRSVIDERVILGQLITGIGYLHSQGIVHGDIRPDSALLWRHHRGIIIVKITNFGLSKSQSIDTSQYSSSTPLGTKGYIAPEILAVGDPERVKRTFASDMWSLGVVIYFAMSRGEHPFSYRNPTEPNNCREEMLRRTKMLRNVSQISEYWQSADLIYQLIDPIPENRPNIYTVLLHPLFSMYNETTKNYFAYQMSRFSSTHPTNLLTKITADSVTTWYTKHYHNEFKAICDSDLHKELVEELKKRENQMEVVGESDVADLHPGMSEVLRLVKKSRKLFPIYLWWLMISQKPTFDECKERFFLTPMNYSMIYMSSRFFNELWMINGHEKNKPEIPRLVNLSAALCRPVVTQVVLNGIRSIRSMSFEGSTALHMACRRRADSTELVKFLLSKEADVQANDSAGKTALDYAQANEHQPALKDMFIQ